MSSRSVSILCTLPGLGTSLDRQWLRTRRDAWCHSPRSTDVQELAVQVRFSYADLLSTSAALQSLRGDEEGAREVACEARRLNVTTSVSDRKLLQALSKAQRAAPHDMPGLRAAEVRQLQVWRKFLH